MVGGWPKNLLLPAGIVRKKERPRPPPASCHNLRVGDRRPADEPRNRPVSLGRHPPIATSFALAIGGQQISPITHPVSLGRHPPVAIGFALAIGGRRIGPVLRDPGSPVPQFGAEWHLRRDPGGPFHFREYGNRISLNV
jgi:hypothetical protein